MLVAFSGGGFAATPERMASMSQLDRLATTRNWLVVYPESHGGDWNAGSCCQPPARRSDDVGLLPVAADAAEALVRLAAAYERRSIALTSNVHPAGFDELMPKTLAAATVDRLLHHAHVLLTDGTDSYRLTQATTGQG